MTGRERLLNILHGDGIDRPAWTTLVDRKSRAGMPRALREMSVLDFYRHVDCDVLQWSNWGLESEAQFVIPSRLVCPHVEESSVTDPDGTIRVERRTDWGTLTATFRDGHPVKHAVQSLDDVRMLTNIWLNSRYEEVPDDGDSYSRTKAIIGDSGILADSVAPSPVQQLIEVEMGLCAFYYLLQDHEREMRELLDVMHARRLEEYRILARRSQADVIIPVENTSSMLTSPTVYAQYSLPQLREYVDVLHDHGKMVVLHMCGHLRDLLGPIRETGLDGINALTPPPVGDTRWEDVLDAFGEDFVILGGVLPPELLHKSVFSERELCATLDDLFTPRIRSARFLLWAAVDGLPTEVRRLEAVGAWARRQQWAR